MAYVAHVKLFFKSKQILLANKLVDGGTLRYGLLCCLYYSVHAFVRNVCAHKDFTWL